MDEFLTSALSFPTVVFTVLLGVAAVYWLLVFIGAMGMDALDLDHGSDHGAGHADVGHSAGDGDAAHADGHGHDAHGHDGPLHVVKGWSAFVGLLKLNAVPVSISLSLVFFWAWLASHVANHYLLGPGAGGLAKVGVAIAALVLALPLASLTARPLAPFFRTHAASHRATLVGKVVMVDTSVVDRNFGVAKAEDGGAGLQIEVRADVPNSFKRGDRALIVAYDEARESFEIAQLDDILPSESPERSAKS